MLKGFSLIELSIVLVILGLLTGSILAGQSLIRAAELRAMPTEISRYNAAVLAFRDKYFQLPGDFTKAEDFWGIDPNCPGDFTAPATDSRTCKGDGNGHILGNVGHWSEVWRAWQHLANAGLIEGRFTGVSGSQSFLTMGTAGLNIPLSKAQADSGYAYVWRGEIISGHPSYYPGSYGNALMWGGGEGMDERFLLAEEAWNIDNKMDDGKPGSGRMRSMTNTPRPNCASSNNAATATYQLANRTRPLACNLFFISGF